MLNSCLREALETKFCRRDPSGMTLMTPFVVSKKRKTLYLHIAKTGGSSITNMLRANSLDDKILTNKRLDFKKKREHFLDIIYHWDDYYKFTFIRNKYDLLVSHWHYDKKKLKVSFGEFIRDIVVPSEDIYGYWIDQYYLTVAEGGQIFDFVGQTGNFVEDLKTPFRKIGIKKYDPNKRDNAGRYDRSITYSSYYDEETKNLVYNKFKQEIDYFNFEVRNG